MGYLARDVAVVLGLAAGAYFANSWLASQPSSFTKSSWPSGVYACTEPYCTCDNLEIGEQCSAREVYRLGFVSDAVLPCRLVWPLYWAAQGTMFWALFVVGHDWYTLFSLLDFIPTS